MPTYSYECRKCGHVQDVFHPMLASPRVVCGQCRGRCRKLFGTGAGIIFKGAGFYETDYKRKSEPSDGGKTADKAEKKAKEDRKEDRKDKAEPKPAGAPNAKSESASSSKTDA